MTMPWGCREMPTGHHWAPYYHPYPYAWWQAGWAQTAPMVCGPVVFPQEVLVDAATPQQNVFVGGGAGARLVLEYMPPDATAAVRRIEVAILEGGATHKWYEDPVEAGYHVKQDFQTVSPGAAILIVVAGVVARLRWCEVVQF